jgi:hypothetical protein
MLYAIKEEQRDGVKRHNLRNGFTPKGCNVRGNTPKVMDGGGEKGGERCGG